ncbi:MAG: MBL fold metallo-hydrolase [Myxococcales bacterium]|nr:MBL fold metallo-hydrolase [Myxococcales bacterium]
MSTTHPLRLREDVHLGIVYDDRTPFGSGLSGLSDALIQRTCAPLRAAVSRDGWAAVEAHSQAWMDKLMGPRALGALYERPDVLREACVYPPAEQVVPVGLTVAVPGTDSVTRAVFPLDDGLRASLAGWMGQWQAHAPRPRSIGAAALWDRLHELGAFEPDHAPRQPLEDGVTFIGHATVAVQALGTQLLFDPYLIPPSAADPPGLRPHTACDLRPSAMFVTHSHADHFDPATLLRFPADTPIVVPVVPRESLLSTDMARRLRELGFSRVCTLGWHDALEIGPLRVTALPFYGEQPTDDRMLHPEARNLGNTYLVEGLGRRVALVADAGRDEAGSTIDMAAQLQARRGPLDVLFGGFRAWRVAPIRYVGTSIARYLLFVPREDRTRVQQIMNDADDFVATGRAWGARTIVPYANGGTPWFARIGLGPHGDPDHPDDENIDPPLELVERAMAEAAPADAVLVDQTVKLLDGTDKSLADYRGKALLLVNTASECGYTPQYADLQALYAKYKGRGLEVLAFPSNDFGGQEPGTPEQIREFVDSEYAVEFEMFDKVAIKGPDKAPLYRALTEQTPEGIRGEVKWNFTKFLVDPQGRVVQRFESAVEPTDPQMIEAIERVLPKA